MFNSQGDIQQLGQCLTVRGTVNIQGNVQQSGSLIKTTPFSLHSLCMKKGGGVFNQTDSQGSFQLSGQYLTIRAMFKSQGNVQQSIQCLTVRAMVNSQGTVQ